MNWHLARASCAVMIGILWFHSVATAWTFRGHEKITAAAIDLLDEALPHFSAQNKSLLIRASAQPDIMRFRGFALMRDFEAPRHYLDLELLEGAELPSLLSDYIKLLTRLSEKSGGAIGKDWQLQFIGLLPYALVESSQRLAIHFAQLRRIPSDQNLMAMAMIEAGNLAHYAQDLCQPLHTTVHHDGRVSANGLSPYTGIHRQVDSLPGRVSKLEDGAELRSSQSLGPLFPAVLGALGESHSLVDKVYLLEGDLLTLQATGAVSPAVEAFTRERFATAVLFTSDLIHTAWQLSSVVELPQWAVVGAARLRLQTEDYIAIGVTKDE